MIETSVAGMRVLFGYLTHHRRLILVTLCLATISQVFSLLDPLIFRRIIDDYATRADQYTVGEFARGVLLLLAASVGVNLVSRVALAFHDYGVSVVSQRLGTRLYTDGIRHVLALPYRIVEDQRSGETLGMLQRARTDAERFITTFVSVVPIAVVSLTFIMAYAATVHWAIVPAFVLTLLLLAGLAFALSRKIRTMQTVIVAETTALAGATTESLRNIELVKSLGLTDQEVRRLSSTTTRILELELTKVRYLRSLAFVQGTAVNIMRAAILLLLLVLIVRRQISIGDFFAIVFYSFYVFGPLQEVGNVMTSYRVTEASLAGFRRILDRPVDVTPATPHPIGDLAAIEFRDVTFVHDSASTPALANVSFRADRGETVAFVGPSGAGKTTLVKLLVGLYAPTAGRVLYDGVESTAVDLDAVRERVGLVTQDTQLFAGSIRENLQFVRPNATDDDCTDVLHRAAAQGLLERGDRGLDTVIGEGGMKISGGEKQRLSIARALLRRPQLLVFDEATSALDSLTETEVGRTMREVAASSNVITIMIAHRLATVMHADRIYVLERGRIVDTGRHEALVEARGLYYAMWRQQAGERRDALDAAADEILVDRA